MKFGNLVEWNCHRGKESVVTATDYVFTMYAFKIDLDCSWILINKKNYI